MRHPLNRPSWRTLWTHAWPWLLVLVALEVHAGGSCTWFMAGPALMLVVLLTLAVRRPQHPRLQHARVPQRRR